MSEEYRPAFTHALYIALFQAMLKHKSFVHRVAETKRYLMLKCHDDPGINAEHVGMNRAL